MNIKVGGLLPQGTHTPASISVSVSVSIGVSIGAQSTSEWNRNGIGIKSESNRNQIGIKSESNRNGLFCLFIFGPSDFIPISFRFHSDFIPISFRFDSDFWDHKSTKNASFFTFIGWLQEFAYAVQDPKKGSTRHTKTTAVQARHKKATAIQRPLGIQKPLLSKDHSLVLSAGAAVWSTALTWRAPAAPKLVFKLSSRNIFILN